MAIITPGKDPNMPSTLDDPKWRPSYGTASSSSHHHSAPPAPILEIVAPAQQKQVPINRYEYIYGIKEIKVNSASNARRSIFVSTPVYVEGNIAQISLESSEIHPFFTPPKVGTSNSRHTSIEYYISYVDHPSEENWIPILPKQEERVVNELLFIKNNQATFRFPALINKDIEVYEDGILIDPNEKRWSVLRLGTGIAFDGVINPSADYTVNYYPNREITNPYVVDIAASQKQPVRYIDAYNIEGEVFLEAKSNCSITLSHTPYIDYNFINSNLPYDPNTSSYKPIEVYLEKGSIVVPNNKVVDHVDPYDPTQPNTIYTKNVTDYINKRYVELKPYSLVGASSGTPENMVFEYYQDGNKLVFTENFQASSNIENISIAKAVAQIRVKYSYLVSSIRVKIILRRTGKSDYAALTPAVERYTLQMKTLE